MTVQVKESENTWGDACKKLGLPQLDLTSYNLKHSPTDLIDQNLVKRYQALPLAQYGNVLTLAVADPCSQRGIDELRFHTGLLIDLVIVEKAALRQAIEHFTLASHNLKNDLDNLQEDAIQTTVEDTSPAWEEDIDGANDTPIVKAVNDILQDAIRTRTSDIHIEPYQCFCRIRFRQDGLLYEVARPPITLAGRLISRLKILAELDIAERRIPQDGRIKVRSTSGREIDFRISTLPTLWGEKVVLRLLDPAALKLGIEHLGFNSAQESAFRTALEKPQGLILVTGPTGSGKSVTLYSGLALLNEEKRNISTAEDPVEIHLDGINQVQISPRKGLTFATAMRAFLRQDPDVVMVGEIRDLDTADISIKAAQTGHLVLATLHTNSAVETLTRLRNMGIANFNLASSISLIIAQRLVRKLCEFCKTPVKNTRQLDKILGVVGRGSNCSQIFQANGCNRCRSGYSGRVGIYEVVPITEPISRIIIAGADSIKVADCVQTEGFKTLRQAALEQVMNGRISLMEANRLTGVTD